jgi:ABC-type transporter Mla subunit MlaD
LRGEPLFIVSIVLGSAAIFLSEPYDAPYLLGIAAPLVIMGIYMIIGLSGFIDSVDKEAFADSVYYMGFLLTLVSLAAALLYLRNESPELGLLVSKFGLALITTIAGLAVRVALVNFRVDVRQARDLVEEQLTDSVRRFNRDVEFACERLEVLMTGTLDKIESTAAGMIEQSDDTASTLKETNEFHTAQLKEMYARVGTEWANSVTRLATMMEQQLAAAATETMSKIDRIGKKIDEEVDSFSIDGAVFSGALDAPLKQFAVTIDDARLAFADELDKLRTTTAGQTELREQFSALAGTLGEADKNLVALREYTGNLGASFSTLSSLSDNLAGVNEQAASVATNLDALNSTVSRTSTSLFEDVESSKETFLKLQQSLNVLLHAVMKQSEQMAEVVNRIGADAERGRAVLSSMQQDLDGPSGTNRDRGE